MKHPSVVVFLGLFFAASCGMAQTTPFNQGMVWGLGVRSLGMGGAYTAVADDYSGILYNPAGLGQVQSVEISGSFSHLSVSDRAVFMQTENSESSGFSKLNGLGVVFPIPTSRGSMALGFGYQRTRMFDGVLRVSQLITTPGDSVTQGYNELEDGGLGQTSLGASLEMAPGVFLGTALHFWTGGDDYIWEFTESDAPFDIWTFSEFHSLSHFNTRFTGFNVSLGTLVRMGEMFRFGASLSTPVTLSGEEDWDYTETTQWDDGVQTTDTTESGWVEYKIRSSWMFQAGVALKVSRLLVSADLQMTDYGQMKYTTDPPVAGTTMAQANLEIKQNFRSVLDYRVGAELVLPFVPVRLRAGYGTLGSYLKNGPNGMDREVYSAGAGIDFKGSVGIDIAYAQTTFDNPAGEVIEGEKVEHKLVMVSFLYRM